MRVVTLPERAIAISDYDLETVSHASRRAAEDDFKMSDHEFNAAAIINGRLDDLGEDFRRALVRMGRAWSHTVIEVIFDHWEREMALRPDDPACPVGDQRIFTR